MRGQSLHSALPKGEIIVGLDIGTTKICAIIAEACVGEGSGAFPTLNLLGIGQSPSDGIRRGIVVDIDRAALAIRAAVDAAQLSAGAEVHGAIVGVTGEHIASLNARGVIPITHHDREITREDVTRVMENSRVIVLPPDREIIHAIPRGFAIDGQNGIRSPVGMCGARLEVETHIVTGATTFLRNVAACVERAGLHIVEMVLEPIAAGEAVLRDEEKDLGVALLDIGGGTSDLALFRGGDIGHTAVVPMGGETITRDISVCLRVGHDEAERIKCAYGSARAASVRADAASFPFTHLGEETPEMLSPRDLAEIIEPRAQEMYELDRWEMLRSADTGYLAAGLVLSGGGALLDGVRGLAAEITGMPTRIGVPIGAFTGLPETQRTPPFATSLGLLQWGAHRYVRTSVRRRGASGGLLNSLTTWMRRITHEVLGRP